MDRRKSTGKGVPKPKPKPKPKPLPKPLPKPAKPYPVLPPAPSALSGQSLSQPVPFLHVLLPLPAPAPPVVPPPQLANVPLPAALAPPPMPTPSSSSSSTSGASLTPSSSSSTTSTSGASLASPPPPSSSSSSTSGASLASPSPASTLESIYNSPLSISGTPPPRIPPPLTNTRIPFPRSHLPVQALFGPGRQLEPAGRWAVMPNSGGLRLYWADAQLDSAQLSEPRWLPGAVDPGLQPDDEECSETESVNVLHSSPVESADLGEESSGSYLLCFSCSFLLLISVSLSTFCNSLAWQ